MIINLSLLIIGGLLLVKGSEVFVDSSSSIAKKLGVSDFIIGLTLVALGTSIPELASSIIAAIQGYSGIIIGNIIGSNIANIGVILAITIIMKDTITKKDILKRDGYIMMGITLLFYLLALDGVLNWTDGVIFLAIYTAYLAFLIKSKNEMKSYHFKEFIEYFFKFEYLLTIKDEVFKGFIKKSNAKITKNKKKLIETFKESVVKDALMILISVIIVIIGANFFIKQAVYFSERLGIPTVIVGVTVIALGTSLPELSVSISAAKKGFGNMSVGNIIGSNVSNILLILGISSLITPVMIGTTTLSISTPFLVVLSVLLLLFMNTDEKLKKYEGIILLIAYLAFIVIITIAGLRQ